MAGHRAHYLSPDEIIEKTEKKVAVGIRGGSWDDLENLAGYQKGVLFCLLLQVAAAAAIFTVPDKYQQWVFIGSGVATLISAICVFAAGFKTLPILFAMLLGIITLTPTIGYAFREFTDSLGPAKHLLSPVMAIIPLLIVYVKAGDVLKKNGIKVGLLVTEPGQFEEHVK